MEAVLVEFKLRVAEAKAEFKARPKEEKKEMRAFRKSINTYVEKVKDDWRAQMAEEKRREKQLIRDVLAESSGRRRT